jgi:hypothetical protein
MIENCAGHCLFFYMVISIQFIQFENEGSWNEFRKLN